MKVTSIYFREMDTNQQTSINHDSTYFTTDLTDGSLVTFTSISNQLDDTLPIEEQMEYVPGRVVIELVGEDAEGDLIRNYVALFYGGEGYCQSEPLILGDTIGWIVLVSCL